MAKLSDELQSIDAQLDDVTLYEKDPDLVKEISIKQGTA